MRLTGSPALPICIRPTPVVSSVRHPGDGTSSDDDRQAKPGSGLPCSARSQDPTGVGSSMFRGRFNRGQVFHVPLAPKQITGAEAGLMRADASVDRRHTAPQVGRNLPHAVSVLRIGVEQGGDVVTTRDEIAQGRSALLDGRERVLGTRCHPRELGTDERVVSLDERVRRGRRICFGAHDGYVAAASAARIRPQEPGAPRPPGRLPHAQHRPSLHDSSIATRGRTA